MDESGKRVDRWEQAHTEENSSRPSRDCASTAPRPTRLPVAIEATRGLVVDRLLAAGQPIVPVHPNAFRAIGARCGAKTDAGDSMKLADYLRTDGHLLPRLDPTEQATLDLQALTRTRAHHVAAKVAALNQLAAPLDEHWPGGKAVFADRDSDIAFLERYITPAKAAKLTPAKLKACCKRRGYSGKKPGSVVIGRLRAVPKPATHLS